MEINKKILLSFLLVMCLSLTMVSAATGTVSLDLPAASATVTGTFVLNVTNSTFDEMVNCTFTIASTSTANTSVTIGTFSNDTLDNVNATFDSTTIEDSNDYTVTASCRNSTNDQATDTSTSVTVDNTIPQTPSSLSPSDESEDTDGSVTFSGTVTGVNTTGCTLYFTGKNPGSSSYTMTHSANTCTYTHSSVPEEAYDWYIRASDGTNTTDSSTYNIRVDTTTSAGKAAKLIEQQGVEPISGALISVPIIGDVDDNIVWLVVIVIAVLVIMSISKRR
jgi:hypothetical protein